MIIFPKQKIFLLFLHLVSAKEIFINPSAEQTFLVNINTWILHYMIVEVDILEDYICRISPNLLDILLIDRTASTGRTSHNIFWATSDYENLGKGYEYSSPILPQQITGRNGHIIMPRVLKKRDKQQSRSREMAEVFTPSWICNTQNNLIDEAWFGRKEVFNTEYIDESGAHKWRVNPNKIVFSNGKSWKDYVRSTRMEITCGEAPYIASRYDTTTGMAIPIEKRIGLLDRKLRVVTENAESIEEWIEWVQIAFKNIYAYEWQGDNLLIARENMLISFLEYYQQKFVEFPPLTTINDIAYIISWNIWQMDGLKFVIPNSCKNSSETAYTLFGEETNEYTCEGCKKNNPYKHNGIYCYVMDWETNKKVKFVSLIKK